MLKQPPPCPAALLCRSRSRTCSVPPLRWRACLPTHRSSAARASPRRHERRRTLACERRPCGERTLRAELRHPHARLGPVPPAPPGPSPLVCSTARPLLAALPSLPSHPTTLPHPPHTPADRPALHRTCATPVPLPFFGPPPPPPPPSSQPMQRPQTCRCPQPQLRTSPVVCCAACAAHASAFRSEPASPRVRVSTPSLHPLSVCPPHPTPFCLRSRNCANVWRYEAGREYRCFGRGAAVLWPRSASGARRRRSR